MSRTRIFIIIIILSLSYTSFVNAGINEALQALKQRDYGSALPQLHEAAKNGNTHAQVIFARMLSKGLGVKTNHKHAVYWLEKAALKVPEDIYVSMAQITLAGHYWDGKGVSPDKNKAVSLYFKAARNGHPVAQSIVAGFHYKGQIVKKDIIQALKWTLISAANGNKKSQNSLNNLRIRVTRQQMTEAHNQAKALFPKIKLPVSETAKLVFDIPRGWKHAYTAPRKFLKEYIPKNQSITDWTDMLTVVTYPQAMKIERLYKHHLQRWKKICGKLSHNQDQKIESKAAFTTGYLLVICNNPKKSMASPSALVLDKEVLMIKFFVTRATTFEVQRAYHHRKGIAKKQELVKRLNTRLNAWNKFFSEIKVCGTSNSEAGC